MTSTRKLFWNAFAMVLLAVLQRGLGLIGIFLLVRILDLRGLGAYTFTQSTSQTTFGLVRLGADAGLHVTIAKLALPEEKAHAEVVLGEALVLFLSLAAVAAGILCLLANPIASQLFAAPELAPFVIASAVILVGQIVSQYCAMVFAGLNSFVAYAQLTWATSLLTLGLTVGFALGFGGIGAAWGAAAGSVAMGALLSAGLFLTLRKQGIRLRLRAPSNVTVSLLGIGLPFYLSGLLLIPADYLCIGYLNRLEGTTALGELRVVQSLMSVAAVLPSALSGPMLSHLSSNFERDGSVATVLTQLRAVWMLSLAITIALATLWPLLVHTIFGAHFSLAASAGAFALLSFTPMMLSSVLTGAFLASRASYILIAIGALQIASIAVLARPMIGDYGIAGYLGLQAIYASIGTIAGLLLLGLRLKQHLLRPWMLHAILFTIALSALIVVGAETDHALMTRFVVGLGMMALLAVTSLAFVFSSAERKMFAARFFALLAKLKTCFRSSPGTV